jgi:hypothetical protein
VHGLAPLSQAVDIDDHHEVVQALHAGMLDGLPDRSLGHLGIAAQRPHPVGQPIQLSRAQCDARGDRHSLTERTGRHVDPGQLRRGVSLQPGTELAEGQKLLVGDGAGGGEHRVDERRRVTLGEDQVIVVGVGRIGVVVAQMARHEDGHEVGRGHRRRGVAGGGGIRRANRVDAQALGELMDLFVGHQAFLWSMQFTC